MLSLCRISCIRQAPTKAPESPQFQASAVGSSKSRHYDTPALQDIIYRQGYYIAVGIENAVLPLSTIKLYINSTARLHWWQQKTPSFLTPDARQTGGHPSLTHSGTYASRNAFRCAFLRRALVRAERATRAERIRSGRQVRHGCRKPLPPPLPGAGWRYHKTVLFRVRGGCGESFACVVARREITAGI